MGILFAYENWTNENVLILNCLPEKCLYDCVGMFTVSRVGPATITPRHATKIESNSYNLK